LAILVTSFLQNILHLFVTLCRSVVVKILGGLTNTTMLELLRIRNLALIQDMELEFSEGLNVLTGESGVGKSFILRALDFILGEKLKTDMVRPGEEKAQVEAVFVLSDGEYIVKRELLAGKGRSRVYINDNLASQDKIRDLRSRLIVHTSQHGQQRLLNPSFHTSILDTSIPSDWLAKKDHLLSRLRQVAKQKYELEDKVKELEHQRDFLEYQKNEIQKVGPLEGEENDLEARRTALQDQTKAQEGVQRGLDLLYSTESSLIDNVFELHKVLDHLGHFEPGFADSAPSVAEFGYFLQELGQNLRNQPLLKESEQELEEVQYRLWQLSQLQRKLNRSLPEIVNLQEEIEANLNFLDTCNLDRQQLERQEENLVRELKEVLESVNQSRDEVAQNLSKHLEEELRQLGFSSNIEVVFELEPVEIFSQLYENRARLMWVPNPGQPSQPLDRIASGGELSRFLLALVGLMSQNSLPTLLFDEVDAGIGGMILGQVGQKIRQLANRQQVVLISHWPQLACLADRHFQVRKEVNKQETFTLCTRLEQEQVVEELARMAGGGNQGRIMAQQLLGRKGR
jgi:DNA repair protein RecN (Recombination protein N)